MTGVIFSSSLYPVIESGRFVVSCKEVGLKKGGLLRGNTFEITGLSEICTPY